MNLIFKYASVIIKIGIVNIKTYSHIFMYFSTLIFSSPKPVRNPNGISTVAVDPNVIPLGSKVYVSGYGVAIAADTGGAIKGNIIDVFLNSYEECMNWGRREVTVQLLAYPGEW